ncbi:MAG: 2-polyprenylphenol 6-hydroxylase [Hyphomicrobiaceae bacterium]|nr:2-polyprenylphenol 6-hydroxylase [Hyphomicrobiaceae bacterium]
MASAIANLFRLARAGLTLAQYGVSFVPKGMKAPLALHVARLLVLPVRLLTWPLRARVPKERRTATALASLGPSYIKLGQFLATRADLIGPELAADLRHLQDRLAPFPMAQARRAIEEALGGRLEDHFLEVGPPVAAASIAQVHKARVRDADGTERWVAVKILRPGVERRFRQDLDSYYLAARVIERVHAPSRRLKPMAVVDTLKATTELEMDLRLEAAAMSELAENIRADTSLESGNFRVPAVDWRRTARRVLTVEWIDGTPIADRERLVAAGHDPKALGQTVLRSFLRHAMRDGFFHADMHQGNLLVDAAGNVVAVDFGIMGRLGAKERRFLAEILHGLITRDYRRAAEVHFWAGYVPPHHPVEVFAQALRAIGEPIHGRTAEEISMADLLGQLFAYTEVFDMETRPELINLQKTMVVVEGVARGLDPSLDIWTAAEPIAREWIETNLGPAGALKDARVGAGEVGKLLAQAPGLLADAERMFGALATMARAGIRLDDASVARLADEEARRTRSGRLALWLAAASLALLAASHVLGGT